MKCLLDEEIRLMNRALEVQENSSVTVHLTGLDCMIKQATTLGDLSLCGSACFFFFVLTKTLP